MRRFLSRECQRRTKPRRRILWRPQHRHWTHQPVATTEFKVVSLAWWRTADCNMEAGVKMRHQATGPPQFLTEYPRRAPPAPPPAPPADRPCASPAPLTSSSGPTGEGLKPPKPQLCLYKPLGVLRVPMLGGRWLVICGVGQICRR